MGHEDVFPRPKLSARCWFSQRTFAGTRGNGRDAPKAATTGGEQLFGRAKRLLLRRRSLDWLKRAVRSSVIEVRLL